MDRFGSHRKHPNTLLLSLLLTAALLTACFFGLGSLGRRDSARSKALLASAIERDITECYALEGTYPPSLSYMEEHYGLTYDSASFYVDYQPVAANIRPDYTIIEVKDGR
ncbi:MAG: hypothetical protein LKJ76_03590 [Lachnospiraceae bacterium]|jgi:hypothetical protein|nr:hypothetical protein [Lachnospiraceae bacterium]